MYAQLIYQTSDVHIDESNFGIVPSTATVSIMVQPSMSSVEYQRSKAIHKVTSNHTFYFAADYLNGDVAGTHPRRMIQKAPPRIDGGDDNSPDMPEFTPIGDGLPYTIVLVIIYMFAVAGRRYHTKHKMQ